MQKAKLFHNSLARSCRVVHLLHEMGKIQDVEIIHLDLGTGEHLKNEELAKINPQRKVPAFQDGEVKLFESFAIVQYLLEKYKSPLIPPPKTQERSKYYQWTYFVASTVDDTIITYLSHIFFLPPNMRDPKIADEQKKKWNEKVAPILEDQLKQTKWIIGENFTAADVILAFILSNADKVGLLQGHSILSAYVKQCSERQAYQLTYGK